MKKVKLFLAIIVSLVLSTIPVFASQATFEDTMTGQQGQQKLTTTKRNSLAALQLRGEVVSMASIGISNEGNGVIGILATTHCHVPVERIRTRIYLDRLNESTGVWETLEYRDFDEYATDYPDQVFSSSVLSFEITGYPSGYYYRARGLFSVWKNGESQGYGASTNGIMITDY